MKANLCRIKIIRDANPQVVGSLFDEWAASLSDECVIEGQPALEFSASLAQFVIVCIYESPKKKK